MATVTGQIVAALVVMRKGIYRTPDIRLYPGNIKKIYYLGIPNILMQSAYTFYILGLNLILAGFSDQEDYGTRTVLQMADHLLYSAWGITDLYRADRELQLCGEGNQPVPGNHVRFRKNGNGTHVYRYTLL